MIKWIRVGLVSISGALMLMGVALEVVNLFTRAFGYPINGTYELIGWLIGISMALGLSHSQINHSHVNIGGLVKQLPRLIARVIEIILSLLATILFALAAWKLFANGVEKHALNSVSQTLMVPLYPLNYALGATIVCLAVVLAVQTLINIKKCIVNDNNNNNAGIKS